MITVIYSTLVPLVSGEQLPSLIALSQHHYPRRAPDPTDARFALVVFPTVNFDGLVIHDRLQNLEFFTLRHLAPCFDRLTLPTLAKLCIAFRVSTCMATCILFIFRKLDRRATGEMPHSHRPVFD
jgi:hypothetical protein